MKSFYQLLESMGFRGFVARFYGTPEGNIDRSEVNDTIKMPVEGYVFEYMKSKGLFLGKEILYPFDYPQNCGGLETKGKFVAGITPKERVSTRKFAKLVGMDCVEFISSLESHDPDSSKNYVLLNLSKLYRLVDNFFKQATGIATFDTKDYRGDLVAGIVCIIDTVLKPMNATREMGTFGGRNPIAGILWSVDADTSVDEEEVLELPASFEVVMDEVEKPLKVLPSWMFTSENVQSLINDLNAIKSKMNPSDENMDHIQSLLSMANTAKRKGIGVSINPRSL